jgi:DNA-binding IclR family transcriptional regulator
MLPAQPNQSLIDGLTCLQLLAGRRQPIGVRELARELHLEPTRASRLLKTLAHLGLAQQTIGAKYQPGPAIHVLAAQSLFGSELLRRALNPLQSLQGCGLIVALGVLWRDQVCYLYHAAPGMNATEALGRVGLFPAVKSGIGQVLLAELNQTELKTLLRREGGLSKLSRDIKKVKAQGYSQVTIDIENHTETLAVPVGNPVVAAVALSGRIQSGQKQQLLKSLKQVAAEIGDLTMKD